MSDAKDRPSARELAADRAGGLDDAERERMAGRPNGTDAAAGGPGVLMPAAEWLKQHDRPPDAELVPDVPGTLYRGRPALLHQKRGGGKSTYAAAAASSASRAGFGVVLLIDDDPGTWAKRLRQFGADLAHVRVGIMRDVAAAGLREVCAGADVVIVDSWRRWAAAAGVSGAGALNDESAVGPVIDALADLARLDGAAVLVLTNQPKYNESARGSFAVEDAVDLVRVISVNLAARTSTVQDADPPKRREGIPAGPFVLTLGPHGFEVGAAAAVSGPMVPGEDGRQGARIGFAREWRAKHPGGSFNQFHKAARAAGLGARREVVGAAFRVAGEGGSRDGDTPPPEPAEPVVPGSGSAPVPIARNQSEPVVPVLVPAASMGNQSEPVPEVVPGSGSRNRSGESTGRPCTVCRSAPCLPADTHCGDCRTVQRWQSAADAARREGAPVRSVHYDDPPHWRMLPNDGSEADNGAAS